MNTPLDMTGIAIQKGALVAMAVLSGRSADLDFRVVCEVTEEGRVKVRGLGGDNPKTKPSFVTYPERLVHLEGSWAENWESRIIDAARGRVEGMGMDALSLIQAVDVEEFCRDISVGEYSEVEFFPKAVEAILHHEAQNEWRRTYRHGQS